ncbi:MAG TPA: YggT family protein [Chloroflexaceae bacterium]|nr:YggT family protein [Chloroflexaceae bacterium]
MLIWAAGALEALLLARLLARLLAARPDNPAFALLYAITGPLVAPLRALDYDQPPFGAALEFSTLIMAICVPLLAYVAWVLLAMRNTGPADGV